MLYSVDISGHFADYRFQFGDIPPRLGYVSWFEQVVFSVVSIDWAGDNQDLFQAVECLPGPDHGIEVLHVLDVEDYQIAASWGFSLELGNTGGLIVEGPNIPQLINVA